ncbi:MAG: thioredoxin family protein [Sphingobacteriia bacterium]|nr:thioredoxin family protein [Sphingobacteriia bacterium]
MKRYLFIIVSCFFFLQGNAQMIFTEGNWNTVVAEAKAEKKYIMVDAYTDWCGPCKQMAKNIFPLPQVGDFYNKNFINYKLNMEKGEGVDFARNFQVGVYPSYLFFDSNGTLVHRTVGYKQGPQFIQDGAAALDTTKQLVTNIKKYQFGQRDSETLYNLALGLANAGARDESIENAYLSSLSPAQLITEKNYKFLVQTNGGYRSKTFRTILENRKAFQQMMGGSEVDQFLGENLFRAVQYAGGNRMTSLKDSIVKDIEAYFDSPVKDQYLLYSTMLMLGFEADRGPYYKVMTQYLNSYGQSDAKTLQAYAGEIIQSTSEDDRQQGVKWAQQAVKLEATVAAYEVLATVLLKTGDKAAARKAAESGLALATEKGADETVFREVLRQVQP